MKTWHLFHALALGLLLCAPVAHADLIPPGGKGVSECRHKKAGDACENYVIEGESLRNEPGTCVEEKLDHLHFKFKAHLRCISASVPAGSASIALPSPSVAAIPSVTPSVTTPTVSATSVAPAPIASAATPPETPKASGCSLAADPSSGVAFCFTLLGLGLLFRGRRSSREALPILAGCHSSKDDSSFSRKPT